MLVERFRLRFQSELPEADCFHMMDESVLQDLIRHGPSSGITRRIVTLALGRVPHIPYRRPGADEAADAVAQSIARHAADGRQLRAVMLARLGPYVWHDTPAAAMSVLEELEETARLWLLVRPTPLDEAQIAELRSVFGATW